MLVCVLGTPTLTNAIEETLELVTSFHHQAESTESCSGGLAHRCGAEVVPGVVEESPLVTWQLRVVELSLPRPYLTPSGASDAHVRDLLRPPNA